MNDQETDFAVDKWDITVNVLANRLKSDSPPILIDVREPHELAISQISSAKLIPLGQLAANLSQLVWMAMAQSDLLTRQRGRV